MLSVASEEILDCGDGVRLAGSYSPAPAADHLVILLHGWEGSSDSSYILSAAAELYRQGYSVYRLNFRDHGNSYHLNRKLFNSTRLQEVLDAVALVCRSYPEQYKSLAGFSLGGNFALRIASRLAEKEVDLQQLAAISPLINPLQTTRDIEEGFWVYHYYFLRRWKQSLAKKLALFPEYNYGDVLERSSSLSDLNEYFVPSHTDYDTPSEYLSAYGITPTVLENIQHPVAVLLAEDDPIVRQQWFDELEWPEKITIKRSSWGGHCGFISSWRFTSFADQWLLQTLAAAVS